MSDDARPLIDNPYRASHTPIYAGDVNVTDLMARAWDRGFAAGDERLRSDFQSAASPDERLREAARNLQDHCALWPPGEIGPVEESRRNALMYEVRKALAAADRDKEARDV